MASLRLDLLADFLNDKVDWLHFLLVPSKQNQWDMQCLNEATYNWLNGIQNEWLMMLSITLVFLSSTCFITKAIDRIDGKCHISKLKSSRTCLTG